MRYGNPWIEPVLDEMRAEGCDRILVVPLYPQYAASTTGTAMDEIGRIFARTRNVPGLRFVKHFHDHPAYIARARRQHPRPLARTRPPRQAADELPRPAALHARPRRSVSLRVPQDRAPARRRDLELAGQPVAAHLPVALRPRRMAQALYRGNARGTGHAQACAASMSSVRASSPTASRRSRKSPWKARDTFIEAGGKEFNAIPCLNDRTDWIARAGRDRARRTRRLAAGCVECGRGARRRPRGSRTCPRARRDGLTTGATRDETPAALADQRPRAAGPALPARVPSTCRASTWR